MMGARLMIGQHINHVASVPVVPGPLACGVLWPLAWTVRGMERRMEVAGHVAVGNGGNEALGRR